MLSGEYIEIKPMEKEDTNLLYSWMQDEKCKGNYLDMHMQYKESFLENYEKKFKDASKLYAMISDKQGQPIGIINYWEVPGSSTTLEIGLLIADEASRDKGLGKEALKLFTDYLFKTKNIMRLQYTTRTDNAGMKSIGEKIGYKLEGVLKKFMFVDGEFRDFILMAITRDDWVK